MSGHSALGFAKHSALGIWQQLWAWAGVGAGLPRRQPSRPPFDRKTQGSGQPAGRRRRREGTRHAVGRPPGPRAAGPHPRPQARLPGMRASSPRPHASFPSEPPGLRYANARRVHGRTPEDGQCRRNSHRTGRPCGGPYRSPPNRRACCVPPAIAPPQDPITSRATAPARVKSPCQLALTLVTIPPQSD